MCPLSCSRSKHPLLRHPLCLHIQRHQIFALIKQNATNRTRKVGILHIRIHSMLPYHRHSKVPSIHPSMCPVLSRPVVLLLAPESSGAQMASHCIACNCMPTPSSTLEEKYKRKRKETVQTPSNVEVEIGSRSRCREVVQRGRLSRSPPSTTTTKNLQQIQAIDARPVCCSSKGSFLSQVGSGKGSGRTSGSGTSLVVPFGSPTR